MRYAGSWLFGARLLGLFIAFAESGMARAQEPYPTHVVKMVLPVLPGSTTDIVARLVAGEAIGSLEPLRPALMDKEETVVCRSDPQSAAPVAEEVSWIELARDARNRVGPQRAVDKLLDIASPSH